jgi:hypothetical protein
VQVLDEQLAAGGGSCEVDMEAQFLSLGLEIIGLGVFNFQFGSITNESPVIKVRGPGGRDVLMSWLPHPHQSVQAPRGPGYDTPVVILWVPSHHTSLHSPPPSCMLRPHRHVPPSNLSAPVLPWPCLGTHCAPYAHHEEMYPALFLPPNSVIGTSCHLCIAAFCVPPHRQACSRCIQCYISSCGTTPCLAVPFAHSLGIKP